MAQLKSTVVQGNLAVTDNVSIGGDITTPGGLGAENVYINNSLHVGDTGIGQVAALTKSGIYYEKNGNSNYGTLLFPDNKNGTFTIATTDDIPPVDSALSSTSTSPVQNKVVKSALDSKLSKLSNTISLTFGGNEDNSTPVRLIWTDDGSFKGGTIYFPKKDGIVTLATTDDIQSYIDTAILGGSW